MNGPTKVNVVRWSVELLLLVLGLMALDDGLFSILVASAMAALELYLLISTGLWRNSKIVRVSMLLGKPWVPIVLFMLCFAIRTLLAWV